MMHHSIPGMVSSIRPEKDIKKTFLWVYAFAFVIIIIICYTAVLAFGHFLIGIGNGI
jgi:hypothetical protein